MLVICADLSALAATDRDLDRYQIAGGASIYPFVWSILLAAHEPRTRWRDDDDRDAQ